MKGNRALDLGTCVRLGNLLARAAWAAGTRCRGEKRGARIIETTRHELCIESRRLHRWLEAV